MIRRLIVAGTLVAILVAVPGALEAGAAAARAVAVVIDFGDSQPPLVLCVNEAGASDAQVLADGLAQAGRGGLRFSPTGLLCGIDGYPATGCGAQNGARYSYWAYFHGTSLGWSYAQEGPASHVAALSTAIGFRFETEGTGTPADSAPRTTGDPAVSCPTLVSSTTLANTAPGGVTTSGPSALVSTTSTLAPVSITTNRQASTTASEATKPSPSGSGAAPVLLSLGGLSVAIGAVLMAKRIRGRRAG